MSGAWGVPAEAPTVRARDGGSGSPTSQGGSQKPRSFWKPPHPNGAPTRIQRSEFIGLSLKLYGLRYMF